MKKISLIFIAISLVISCKHNENPPNPTSTCGVFYKIPNCNPTYHKINYSDDYYLNFLSKYGKHGIELITVFSNFDNVNKQDTTIHSFKYNSNGNLTEFKRGDEIITYNYLYSNGLVTKLESNIGYTYYYNYYDNGDMKYRLSLNGNIKIDSTSMLNYNPCGRPKLEKYYIFKSNNTFEIEDSTIFEYDNNNNLIKKLEYRKNANGQMELSYKEEFTYSDHVINKVFGFSEIVDYSNPNVNKKTINNLWKLTYKSKYFNNDTVTETKTYNYKFSNNCVTYMKEQGSKYQQDSTVSYFYY